MKRARLNLLIDAVIGIAFLAPPSPASSSCCRLSWQRRAGRGCSRSTPGTGCTTGAVSIAVGGVALHLALHWRWVVHTTRRWLTDWRGDQPASTSTSDRFARSSGRSWDGAGAVGRAHRSVTPDHRRRATRRGDHAARPADRRGGLCDGVDGWLRPVPHRRGGRSHDHHHVTGIDRSGRNDRRLIGRVVGWLFRLLVVGGRDRLGRDHDGDSRGGRFVELYRLRPLPADLSPIGVRLGQQRPRDGPVTRQLHPLPPLRRGLPRLGDHPQRLTRPGSECLTRPRLGFEGASRRCRAHRRGSDRRRSPS